MICVLCSRRAAGPARCLLAGGALLLLGCNLRLIEPDSFATGRVLRRSENEVELHTSARYDAGAGTFARGLPGGCEVRGGITYNDAYAGYRSIFGAELGLSRSLFQTPELQASATLNAGAFAAESVPAQFWGTHGSLTCAFGYSPVPWLTVFAPLRACYQQASQGFRGLAFVAGLGIGAEAGHAFLGASSEFVLPFTDWSAYLATRWQGPSLQIGYRW